MWLVPRFAVEALSDVAVPSRGLPGQVKSGRVTGRGQAGTARLVNPGCVVRAQVRGKRPVGSRIASVRLWEHTCRPGCAGPPR